MPILIIYHQFVKKDSMANVGIKHKENITLNMYINAQNILPWIWYITLLETMEGNFCSIM